MWQSTALDLGMSPYPVYAFSSLPETQPNSPLTDEPLIWGCLHLEIHEFSNTTVCMSRKLPVTEIVHLIIVIVDSGVFICCFLSQVLSGHTKMSLD